MMTLWFQVSCLMAAFRKGHSKVVKWMVKHVSQFPSDQELTRFISTAVTDKDLVKKCNACMDIIRVAKDKQAAEAAKNANNLNKIPAARPSTAARIQHRLLKRSTRMKTIWTTNAFHRS